MLTHFRRLIRWLLATPMRGLHALFMAGIATSVVAFGLSRYELLVLGGAALAAYGVLIVCDARGLGAAYLAASEKSRLRLPRWIRWTQPPSGRVHRYLDGGVVLLIGLFVLSLGVAQVVRDAS